MLHDHVTPPPGFVPFEEAMRSRPHPAPRPGSHPGPRPDAPAEAEPAPWPEIDASLLDDQRGTVPPFPLHLLPEDWRQWVGDTAQSAGAPVDYVVQGVLAAVAGLCGAGVVARVMPSWSEPLVLWQALVGTPSSGKSPALAVVRDQLAQIEEALRSEDDDRQGRHAARLEQARLVTERWREDCVRALADGARAPARPAEAAFDEAFVPAQIVVADATIEALADVVRGNPRGVVLWRDELTAWLTNLGRYANGGSDRAHWLEAWAAAGVTINRRSRAQPLHLRKFPLSIVGSIQPDRLAEALDGIDDGMTARFLYAWPDPVPFTPLEQRRIARDGDALSMLQQIALAARTPDDPLVLKFSDGALTLFNDFLANLHDEVLAADGLEAGWLGKGRGTVARLAGMLTLLGWSGNGVPYPPGMVDADAVEAAVSLWTYYFRPHARIVLNQAGRTDRDRNARRVVRWLKLTGAEEVAREDIRCQALAYGVDAIGADAVIVRLVMAGVLRPAPLPKGRGRPARRWRVNPALR